LSGMAAETRREGRRRTCNAGSVQDPPVSRRRPTQPPSARVVYGEGHDPFRILRPILDHRLGHVYSPALSRADPIQTRSCVFSARKKIVNAGSRFWRPFRPLDSHDPFPGLHLPGQHRRPEEALTFVLQWRGGNVDPTARWPPHAFPSMAEPAHPSLPPIVRLQRRPRWCLRTLLLSLRLVLPLRLGRGPKPPAQGVRADEHLRGA